MSSRDVIENKISFIERVILEARKTYHGRSLDDFQADRILRGSLERDLYVIVQATIDLAEAVVAYKRLRKPTTMREAFDILAENDIVPSEFVAGFHKIVGFRNILAHGYEAVRVDFLYDVLLNKLSEVEEFLGYLEKSVIEHLKDISLNLKSRRRSGFGLIVIIAALAALSLLIGGGWYVKQKGYFLPAPPGQRACTQDTKLCPDGSAVGRIGPNCEFAICPSASNRGQVTSNAADSPWIPHLIPGKEIPTVRVVVGIAAQIGVAVAIDRDSEVDIPLESLMPLQLAKLGARFAYPNGVPVNIQQSLTRGEIPLELKQWTEIPLQVGSNLDTSMWKTYRNEKYGFEVKYPSDWQYKDFGSTGLNKITTIGFSSSFSEMSEGGGIDAVDITVEYLGQTLEATKAMLARPVELSDFVVDGKSGFRAVGAFYGTRTDVIAGNKYYSISIDQNFSMLGDRMLSTIKFIP